MYSIPAKIYQKLLIQARDVTPEVLRRFAVANGWIPHSVCPDLYNSPIPGSYYQVKIPKVDADDYSEVVLDIIERFSIAKLQDFDEIIEQLGELSDKMGGAAQASLN